MLGDRLFFIGNMDMYMAKYRYRQVVKSIQEDV